MRTTRQQRRRVNALLDYSSEKVNAMDSNVETVRKLATHDANILHLQDDMDKLVADIDTIKVAIQEIQNTLSEAKGGWRILMMLGGASGILGAFLSYLVQHFTVSGGK